MTFLVILWAPQWSFCQKTTKISHKMAQKTDYFPGQGVFVVISRVKFRVKTGILVQAIWRKWGHFGGNIPKMAYFRVFLAKYPKMS